MAGIVVRDASAADVGRIVALNAAEVARTSAMDAQRLGELDALACAHRVAERDGEVVAFLLAMDARSGYDNANFAWFSSRLARFAYIDRIVVDAGSAGLGIGRRLYTDLFTQIRVRGIASVVCEYNLDPPNPASAAFHQRLGFHEIGQQRLACGKTVSMQHLDLTLDTVQ